MAITHKHIDEIFEYDGSQINPSWAFQEFGIYGSSIITWIGPVNITPDNLKDFADVGLEIKSNNMVNFICEFFDQQPPNMRVAYLRQSMEFKQKGKVTIFLSTEGNCPSQLQASHSALQRFILP